VTETYDCSRVPEDERASMDDGRVWVKSMTGTLDRLAVLCAGSAREVRDFIDAHCPAGRHA